MLTKDQFQALAKRPSGSPTSPSAVSTSPTRRSAFIRFALNGVTTSGFVAEQSMSISVTKDRKTGQHERR
jgi:hypothetical protein